MKWEAKFTMCAKKGKKKGKKMYLPMRGFIFAVSFTATL